MTKTDLLLANPGLTDESLTRELTEIGYSLSAVTVRRPADLMGIDEKFDLIYFANTYPPIQRISGYVIDTVFPRLKTPIVYGFHVPSIIFKPHRPSNYLYNTGSLIKMFSMRITKSITACHVLNRDEHALHRMLGLPSYYVPLGVDTESFKIGNKSDSFTTVFMNARYQKGVDMLNRIVSGVLKKEKNVRFILLSGRGAFLSQYLYSLAKSYKDNVEVYEYLPRAELVRILSRSHCLLFPSRYESFGLVILEALSSGMPVVGFDISGAMRDIVKKYKAGLVIKPFLIDGLTQGILKYYELWKEKSEEFDSLSLYLRSIALKYDWKIIARAFDKILFEKVVKHDK